MKKILLTLILSLSLLINLKAQDAGKFGITLTGHIKNEIFYDTRENNTASTTLREGELFVYPAPKVLDAKGTDTNKVGNFNILCLQTRVGGKITAPDVLDAKTSGYIEGEFFGTSGTDVNGFRMRHAYIDLDWSSTQIKLGQSWHPTVIPECMPGVIAYSIGAPFQTLSRNPQVRVTQKFDNCKISISALTQRDFQSSGPFGTSSNYLRNSAIPEMFGTFQYNYGPILFGLGGGYKILKPILSTTSLDTSLKAPNNVFTSNKTIGSFETQAYIKFTSSAIPLVIKLCGMYGQNMSNILTLGGYGVTSIDTATGNYNFTNDNVLISWGEIIYGKEFEVGVFCGYAHNMGTDDNIISASYFYGWDKNIYAVQTLYRVSPRLAWTSGKFKVGLECEYTAAVYGTPDWKNNMKTFKGSYTVDNIRILLGTYIFF